MACCMTLCAGSVFLYLFCLLGNFHVGTHVVALSLGTSCLLLHCSSWVRGYVHLYLLVDAVTLRYLFSSPCVDYPFVASL